ncbi:MAG: AMP-binding protein, partial [Alphaproteobacteria bacterium]|nr:AMP-binding protein [Alphaproteobacteria bacterium]
KEMSYRGGTYYYELSKELREGVERIANEEQASIFMVLLAAFKVLLYKYSGQSDIVVGTPIANRHYKEIEGLIGFFVNTLAIRTEIEGKESFRELVQKVKQKTLQAYEHQDVPFEQLVEYLNINRSLNHNPVFQVMFTVQNNNIMSLPEIDDLRVAYIGTEKNISRFDLAVSINQTSEVMFIEYNYSEELFQANTIKRIGDSFIELIKTTITTPNFTIRNLCIITETDKKQLLNEWNDTDKEYGERKVIHKIFEEQVEVRRDSIAVVYEDSQLTYQELNERANQLGNYLRSYGVGGDILVSIAIDRSLEMIIGLLGILKAGGCLCSFRFKLSSRKIRIHTRRYTFKYIINRE